MKEILEKLTNGHVLSQQEAKQTLSQLAKGEYNLSQMSAFLTIYLMRDIEPQELMGFKAAMLELCNAIDLDQYQAMDMCGTGGDGKDTFNISTTASFVVAGAGQNVAKHGNNGVSSSCGSSNLLAHFGVHFTSDEFKLRKSLDESGICFLHAPLFHPAMKNVAPVRKELGLKTFFNMLGPLVNPSKPNKQLAGVYSLQVGKLYQQVFQSENKHSAVVHALDGYDEISLTGDFKVLFPNEEKQFSPEGLGFKPIEQEEIYGGSSIEESATIFQNVLKGDATKAQKNVVLANAGLALYVGQGLSGFEEGIAKAKESVDSGLALKSFESFLKVNQA